MVFSLLNGEALTNQACIDSTRLSLSDHVENVEDMTSLSWRRAGTSLIGSAKFPPDQRLAFSDWQDKNAAGDEGRRLAMPIRYTDDKKYVAEKTKLSVYVAYKKAVAL